MLTSITIKGTQCQILDKRAGYECFDIPTFQVSAGKIRCYGHAGVCHTCIFSYKVNKDTNCGTIVYNDIKLNFPELFI